MQAAPWNDYERMPNLDESGSARLKHLVDQPHAPIFRNQSGHHLAQHELDELGHFTREETNLNASACAGENKWIDPFLGKCLESVPFYKHYDKSVQRFEDYPTIDRSDLSVSITDFVPDHLPLDRIIAYETSGTTGHALTIPSHPIVAARYSAYHKKALLWNYVDTGEFRSDLAVILAGFQESCFTYASVSPYLNNKALLKLNFHPNDWGSPDDRELYIDLNKPDLISGDPISLSELSMIPFRHRPKAILSTSMTLLKAVRDDFESRYKCPILDLYSLNEVGPVGCSVPGKEGFRLLQSKLLVEILDANGNPVDCGERGEIVLTGGFNDYLPLIRYRTGDFGRLELEDGHWYIRDLEGRPPVQYKTKDGVWLNNVDVTHMLQKFPLSQFSLHQYAEGTLTITLPNETYSDSIKQLLETKLGQQVQINLFEKVSSDKKIIQYSSDLRNIF
ncbi:MULTISPECIES: hypothetical protein [unclassified Oleiphilus]|nr:MULTISPECIES: hypothetical protein [unclassified Oleiphilus]KZY88194.1 hypothetical protein A3741_12795 [Oleiphilus sp. HI0069]KZZ20843.1 hypothetical protein A3749_02995 [Oleiphilus sp. HI0078]KZY39717.1 hypothetical protein A3729_14510 [Oleiphilus sp. HI0043]KZY66622.1 hypothetical protein A3735_07020 [Oleiphilus sp. HI0061]KZZ33716.1 hypothetical protein A3756_03910 [Oleiphilus sp. HI0086]